MITFYIDNNNTSPQNCARMIEFSSNKYMARVTLT